jgi:hypothetical protein
MNAAIEVLGRVEAEVAQLLAAGLGTRRAGRERLEALADEVARLRLERLAVELRSLATTDDPTKAAGAAMASLTLARKLRERLDPWPEADLASGTAIVLDPSARLTGLWSSPQPSGGERSTDSTHGLSGLEASHQPSSRRVESGPHPSPPEAEEGTGRLPEGEGTPSAARSATVVPPSPAGKGSQG